MKHSIKRALALLIALMLTVPSFALAESADDIVFAEDDVAFAENEVVFGAMSST